MTLSSKILIALSLTILVCVSAVFTFKYIELNKKLQVMEEGFVEQKQLLDNIVRAQSGYASKEDIEAFAKNNNLNLEIIKDDLDKLGAKVQGITVVTAVSGRQTTTNIPSTNTTPNPNPPSPNPELDPNGYFSNTQHLDLNEKFTNLTIPIGKVSFSAFRAKPWDVDIKERKYSVVSVLGVNPEGKHYSYSKFSVQVENKVYDVPIADNKFLEEYPENRFYWWNPRLSLAFTGGINVSQTPLEGNLTPAVVISTMSYGKTKINPLFTFGGVGTGYGINSKAVEFMLLPAQYNIGNNLQLIHNTYVGPSVQLNTQGNVTLGAAITVGL